MRPAHGVRFQLVSLSFLLICLAGSGVVTARAEAWRPSGLIGRSLAGGGAAASHADLVLNVNPAGLALADENRTDILALGAGASSESFDAFRFMAVDNADDWRSYIAGEDPEYVYTPPGAQFLKDMEKHAGRFASLDIQGTLLEMIRPDFGAGLYTGVRKHLRQNLADDGSPVPEFDAVHGSEIGAKLAFARDASTLAGGLFAVGLGVDFAIVQDRLDLGIDDVETFESVVRDGARTILFDEPEPEFRYSTRLGFQWRQAQPPGDVYRLAAGAVLVDPVGSREGRERPARLQGGLALQPARRGLPLLTLDFGSLGRPDGTLEDGVIFGVVESLGPLTVHFGKAPWVTNFGATLNLGLLRCEYLNSRPDEVSEEFFDDAVHSVRIVLGTSTGRHARTEGGQP